MDKPIFCFTTKPISDELNDILRRLREKQDVSLAEIEATPEFELGKQMCSNDKSTHLLKGRGKLKAEIVERLSSRGSVIYRDGQTDFSGPIRYEKKLDIVIGFSASGKSSAVAEKISHANGAIIVDNDEVKKEIPEFDHGWGANRVHEESKKINKTIFQKALNEGKNIVLPKVGGDEHSIAQLIKMAKSHGYSVNLHYVEVDKHAALERLLLRFIEKGRFLQPSLILQEVNDKGENNIENTYESLKNSELVDGSAHWDNNVPFGCTPLLKEQRNVDQEIIYGVATNELNNTTSHSAQIPILNPLFRDDIMYNIVSGKQTLIKKITDYARDDNRPLNRDILLRSDTEKLSALLTSAELGFLRRGLEYYDAANIKGFVRDAKIDSYTKKEPYSYLRNNRNNDNGKLPSTDDGPDDR